ncbi:MAG TPA: sigma-70 family RNA polymerase sigma factor [Steroidobacteraceae bacterium]|nr:sigma-70 family RNA polymerase sigma factor [Steroidobacteraceae bacterium]
MDEPIVDSLRAGRSAEAFDALVAAYRRRVYGVAFAIVGSRAAAEDVAQEVFVKLWKSLDRFDGRARLSTWIYAITRNAAISYRRRERPAGSLSDEAVLAEAEAHAAVEDRPGADDATLWRAVAALPDAQRQAVILYYQDERPVEEVAAMLAMPVNTVKTHLHRARARLATALGAQAPLLEHGT